MEFLDIDSAEESAEGSADESAEGYADESAEGSAEEPAEGSAEEPDPALNETVVVATALPVADISDALAEDSKDLGKAASKVIDDSAYNITRQWTSLYLEKAVEFCDMKMPSEGDAFYKEPIPGVEFMKQLVKDKIKKLLHVAGVTVGHMVGKTLKGMLPWR